MGSTQQLGIWLPLIFLVVVMYFFMIRPQKKKEKKITAMRNSLKAGDAIITIGGICGKIVKVKEDKVTIQVGADKTRFEMTKWSIASVESNTQAADSGKVAKAKKEEAEADESSEEPKKIRPKRIKEKEDNAEAKTEALVETVKEETEEPVQAEEPKNV